MLTFLNSIPVHPSVAMFSLLKQLKLMIGYVDLLVHDQILGIFPEFGA